MRRLRTSDRAVAPVVAVVLLLGIGVIALAGFQAEVVPQQNEAVEFEHSQAIQSDLEELSASLLDIRADRTTAGGVREHPPVTLRLGTDYPTRLIAVNPPPPRGAVFTQSEGTVSIDNARVVDAGTFTGDPEENLLNTPHETQLLVYEPDYRVLQNAPTTVFEHSLLYNEFDEASLALTEQRLIRDGSRSINLVVFDGDVSASGLQTTLDPETLDGPTAQVPIEPEEGETFGITLPTRTPGVWTEEVIGTTFDEETEHARAEQTGANEVTITVEAAGEETWTLQTTRVGYDGGEGDDVFSNVTGGPTDPDAPQAVAGPNVTLDTDQVELFSGQVIDLSDIGGTVSSLGTEQRLRSGTPIQSIRYTVTGPELDRTRTIQEFDTSESGLVVDLDERDGLLIDTDDWEPGEHTVTVRGQDAAGYVSRQDADSITVIVQDDEGVFQNVTVGNLVDNQDGQTQAVEFLLGEDLPEGKEVTIDLTEAPEGVEYPAGEASFTLDQGSGDVTRNIDGGDVEIVYTAGEDDTEDDTVVITVEDIDVEDIAGEQYPVEFSALGEQQTAIVEITD